MALQVGDVSQAHAKIKASTLLAGEQNSCLRVSALARVAGGTATIFVERVLTCFSKQRIYPRRAKIAGGGARAPVEGAVGLCRGRLNECRVSSTPPAYWRFCRLHLMPLRSFPSPALKCRATIEIVPPGPKGFFSLTPVTTTASRHAVARVTPPAIPPHSPTAPSPSPPKDLPAGRRRYARLPSRGNSGATPLRDDPRFIELTSPTPAKPRKKPAKKKPARKKPAKKKPRAKKK